MFPVFVMSFPSRCPWLCLPHLGSHVRGQSRKDGKQLWAVTRLQAGVRPQGQLALPQLNGDREQIFKELEDPWPRDLALTGPQPCGSLSSWVTVSPSPSPALFSPEWAAAIVFPRGCHRWPEPWGWMCRVRVTVKVRVRVTVRPNPWPNPWHLPGAWVPGGPGKAGFCPRAPAHPTLGSCPLIAAPGKRYCS